MKIWFFLTSRNTDLARRIPSGTPIEISEAKNEKFISSRPGHNVNTVQKQLFATYDIQPDILLQTSSIEVGKRSATFLRCRHDLPDQLCGDVSGTVSVLRGLPNHGY